MTVQMQMDIARYSKLISPKDTGHNEQREARLLERCPPGHEGKRLVDEPATILDASSAIIAWYLPDTLTNTTQKEIREATDLLAPSLKKSWFNRGLEDVGATPGCINLSPAWFQQGHEAGSDEMVILAVILTNPKECVRSGVSKDLPQMPEALQYWASVFNTLSIISNRESPNHQDHMSIAECFDILTTVGNYSNARMTMPSLQLEFKYNSGCMIAFSGRIVRHGVYDVEGDRIAWAWYMRDSVHIYTGVPSCGWASVDGPYNIRTSILNFEHLRSDMWD
ncbi:hypothetical protein EV424DRAFT_1348492 [Suillus variegatus]|nr:hypothetical protein EV424DRAFT_1348492 [Suillus variegatus]